MRRTRPHAGRTRRGANERRRPVRSLGDSLSRDADAEPASRPSPTDPALRANPCSEVTDPICRLPLPTLFYRPEAVHLGDLLRMWVRPGTRITSLSLGFSRADGGAPDAARTAALFGVGDPYLRASRFQASPPLTKKRELFPGPPPASPSSFASPQWPRPDNRPLRPREWTRAPEPGDRRSPCSGSGILTRFPFEEAWGSRGRPPRGDAPQRPGIGTELSRLLGSTDPCSTAVHMEPFSTSAFKVLV